MICINTLKRLMFLTVFCLVQGHLFTVQAEEPPLRIGVIVPLSGPVSWWGQAIARMAEYAKTDRAAHKAVEIFIEDDQFSAKNAVSAATKLIEQNNVNAILTFSGGPSTAVAEVCERRKIPMIGISAVDSYSKGKEFVFRMFMSNESQMRQFTKEFERNKYDHLGIVTVSQESALATRQVLLQQNPSRFVVDEEIAPDNRDMGSLATKLLAKRPDALVLLVNPPILSMLTRSLRGQGYQGKIFGGVGTFSPSEIDASQGTLVGAIFPSPDRTKAQSLIDRYQSEFHDLPASDALFAYDAISILLEKSGSESLVGALVQQKTISGIMGDYSKQEHSLSIEASLWQVVDSHQMSKL